MAVTAAQLQQLYLAYFGRPADFDGIVFYTTGNWDIWQVAKAFGESPESQSLYGPGFNASVINAIYNNLFNRDAEPAGLLYWSQQVASGALTAGEAALGILLGAQNADATTVANKLTVAAAFTAELDTATEILAYTGDAAAAAARAFLATVTSDPATVTTAEASLPTVVADIVDVGGLTGVTESLTKDPDNFAAANQTYIDTLNGIIDDDGTTNNNTFSDSDNITGNGHTVVNVTVKDVTGGTPVVAMSDIGHLNFINAGGGSATMDGSQWTNVDQITVSGTKGAYINIESLTNDGPLKLKIDAATTGGISLDSTNTVTVGDLTVTGSIHNHNADGVAAVAALGTTGIDITMGSGDDANFAYYHSKTASAGNAVTVGNITVDHVNIVAGTSSTFYTMSVYNYAQATSAASTVGSINLGNVAINAATQASGELYVYNEAWSVTKGAATAGDLTTFWINMNVGSSATAYMYLSNSAYATKGAATVGNVSLGGLSMTGTGYAYLYVSNLASAATGAAKAGNMTIGNVTIHNTSGSQSHYAYYYNYAEANKGAATVGNVSIGNVDMVAGYYNYLSVSNWASNTQTGAVTAGTATVGNVNMVATGTATNYFYLYNSAYAGGGKGGAATQGGISIGNVSMSVATESNYMYVYGVAHNGGSGGAAATVGNITVGTVDMVQVAAVGDSTNYLYISNSAWNAVGTAIGGNVSIGDININVPGLTQADAYNAVYAYNYANAGASGTATLGTFTVGNITAKTGLNGDVSVYLSNWASGGTGGSTGRVTVGNVTMTGSKSASMYMYAYNYMAGVGDVGGITMGNVSIKGNTTSGTAYLTVSNTAASGNADTVNVGSVTLQGKNVWLHVYNEANVGAAGTTTVGNVSLKGGDYGSTNWIWASGDDGVGAMTVGTVSLTTIKADHLSLAIGQSASAGATSGTVTVGDVSMTLTDSDATAGAGASLFFEVYNDTGKTSGGNIVTGNITIGTSGVTTKAAMTAAMAASVSISSVDGTVTVGNITVGAGGLKGATLANTDNLATLNSWFHAQAGVSVTVGNIDYSAYSGTTTIDASGYWDGAANHVYTGAATIKGGKGANTIIDNKGTNTIDLSANTTKADTVYLLNSQSAVKDTGTAGVGGGVVTASQTAVDVITGWAAGDKLALWDDTAGGGAGALDAIDGDGDVIQNTPSQTYAQFLANAEIQITQSSNTAYVAVIGGNTYVAINNGNKVAEIVEITGTHTFTYDGTNLVFLT